MIFRGENLCLKCLHPVQTPAAPHPGKATQQIQVPMSKLGCPTKLQLNHRIRCNTAFLHSRARTKASSLP
jgi:hypothetical protein